MMSTDRRSREAVAPRVRRRFALCVAALMLAALPSCEFQDLTAPLESSLTISANPLFIAIGGHSTVTVVISRPDGVPVADETVVTFTTTLGSIPQQAQTRNGIAEVQLFSGDQVGVATVRARSGPANDASVDIAIGAVVSNITLVANPSSLGPNGGSSVLNAVVFGDGGEPLPDSPVVFSTDAGMVASGGTVLRTGPNGEVQDTLTTDRTATVTVTSGVAIVGSTGGTSSLSASVTVEVTDNEPPQAVLVASPTSVAVDQEVNFSAAGSTDPDGSIVSFEWDFGDGSHASGERAAHRYGSAGTFTVLLVVTDDAGAKASATVDITVVATGADLSDRN